MTGVPRRAWVPALIVVLIAIVAAVVLLHGDSMQRQSNSATGRGTSEPESTPPPPTRPSSYLPFDMPTGPTDRKVFAHYVPWFPISPDNRPADEDYYTSQYLTPDGEGGIHRAYGGWMRDRPLPRPPIRQDDWKFVDIQTDVRQAQSVGIDGFGVDIVYPDTQGEVLDDLLTAARDAGSFSIQVTPDMTGPLADMDPTRFATTFLPYLKHPAAQRLADGRVVLGAFRAEVKPPEWWKDVLDSLRERGVVAAFVPTFLDTAVSIERFASISYGFSDWGGRDPVQVDPQDRAEGAAAQLVQRAHQLGKIWMQSISFQDARPRAGVYWEAENGTTNRRSWQIATSQGAEWANLITWNDYAETTAMAPSVKHGFGVLDVNAYEIARFKYGRYPKVVRDAVFVIHRTQPFDARPSFPQTLLMKNAGDAESRDDVEVAFFSTTAGSGAVRIGGRDESCDVPVGFTVCTFALGVGDITATLRYGGGDRVVVRSPFTVTAQPRVQDEQYVVAGGLR